MAGAATPHAVVGAGRFVTVHAACGRAPNTGENLHLTPCFSIPWRRRKRHNCWRWRRITHVGGHCRRDLRSRQGRCIPIPRHARPLAAWRYLVRGAAPTALVALTVNIAALARAAGVALPEDVPFRAHMTLARCAQAWVPWSPVGRTHRLAGGSFRRWCGHGRRRRAQNTRLSRAGRCRL